MELEEWDIRISIHIPNILTPPQTSTKKGPHSLSRLFVTPREDIGCVHKVLCFSTTSRRRNATYRASTCMEAKEVHRGRRQWLASMGRIGACPAIYRYALVTVRIPRKIIVIGKQEVIRYWHALLHEVC